MTALLEMARREIDARDAEIVRLRAVNAVMGDALREIVKKDEQHDSSGGWGDHYYDGPFAKIARAALNPTDPESTTPDRTPMSGG